MTEDGRPGGGPGPDTSPAPLLSALDVRHNARVGAVAGLALGVAAYLLFVVGRTPSLEIAALYLVSVLVVATATAALVTVVLVVRTILGATLDLRRWARRCGTAGAVGAAGLAGLALVGPAAPEAGAVVTAYRLLSPVCAAGLLCGVWAVNAAHRPRSGYGRLGTVGAVVAGVATLFLWWVVAVDATVLLGRPLANVTPVGFLGVALAVGAGTSLVGAATLRAGAMPIRGPVAALFSLPLALAGLTLVAAVDGVAPLYLDPPAPSPVALSLPVGVAWTLLGLDLRAGRGLAPAAAFTVDLLEGVDATPEPEPTGSSGADGSDPPPDGPSGDADE